MKKGSIRFHTTKVKTEVSLQEVATLLREYGAQRFEQVWEDDRTVAVRFNLPVPEAKFGHMSIVLRPRMGALSMALRAEHNIYDEDQVERIAWRQLKGILEGILMAADSGMFTAAQLFLGMAETSEGESLWEQVISGDHATLLLPATIVEAEWSEG